MNTFIKKIAVAGVAAICSWVAMAEIFPGLLQYKYTTSSGQMTKNLDDPDVEGPTRVLGVLAADLKNSDAHFTNALEEGKQYTLGDNGVYAYMGEIYLEAGKTYTFCSSYDDMAVVCIDGKEIVRNKTYNDSGSLGTITPTQTGWHKFEAFLWNGAGGKGLSANLLSGLMWTDSTDTNKINSTSYRTDATLWNRFMDPGDASFLRIQAMNPQTRHFTVQIENPVLARGIVPTVGTYDQMTNPRQKRTCTAAATQKDGCYTMVLDGYAIQKSTDGGATWSAPVTNLTTEAYTYFPEEDTDEVLTWIYHREDPRLIFHASGAVDLTDTTKWEGGVMPENNKGIDWIIEVDGDTTITCDAQYVYRDVTIRGEGSVTFAGTPFYFARIFVEAGITFVASIDLPPPNSSLDESRIIIRDGAKLLYETEASLSRTHFYIQGGAIFELNTALANSTTARFVFQPTLTKPVQIIGTGSIRATSEKCYLQSALIEPNTLVRDQEVVFVTSTLADDFETNDFYRGTEGKYVGSRFNTPVVAAKQVTATVVDGRPINRYHYDFEGSEASNSRGGFAAQDSTKLIGWTGVNSAQVEFAPSFEGQAILWGESKFRAEFFDGSDNPKFLGGCGTITAYIRPVATDKRLIFTLGPGDVPPHFSLVVENDNTLSVLNGVKVRGKNWGDWIPLATVTGIPDLTTKEHFVAITLSAYGTTLRVDNLVTTTDVPVVFSPSGSGVLGGQRQGVPSGYSELPSQGCWVADFQIYDAILSDLEVMSIWSDLDSTQMATLSGSGSIPFDQASSWSTGVVPAGGEVKIVLEGDTEINLANAHDFVRILVEGEGTLSFVGSTLTAADVVVGEGVVYRPREGETGRITVNDGGSLDVANIANDSALSVIAQGKGVNNQGAIFSSAASTLENAPMIQSLKLMDDTTVRVDAGKPWGVAGTAEAGATLDLNLWNLTKIGEGDFVVDKIASFARGAITIAKGTFTLGSLAWSTSYSTITMGEDTTLYYRDQQKTTGFNINMQPGSTFDIDFALVAGNAPNLRLQPSETKPVKIAGTGNIAALDGGDKMRVQSAFIDHTKVAVNEELTLVVNETGTDFQSNDFTMKLGTRFATPVVSTTNVTVTLQGGRIVNRYHCDFDSEGAWSSGSAFAADSTLTFGWGETKEGALVEPARGGQAIMIDAGTGATQFRPRWFGGTATEVLFQSGVGTITQVIRPLATDKRIVYSIGPGDALPIFMLVVDDDETISLVGFEYLPRVRGNAMQVYASVTGIKNMTTKEHFVAVTFDGRGTTLVVDNLKTTTDKVIILPTSSSSSFGYCRQGDGETGYNNFVAPNGCWLNDWQVYDSALTKEELERIRNKFWPSGFMLIVR